MVMHLKQTANDHKRCAEALLPALGTTCDQLGHHWLVDGRLQTAYQNIDTARTCHLVDAGRDLIEPLLACTTECIHDLKLLSIKAHHQHKQAYRFGFGVCLVRT